MKTKRIISIVTATIFLLVIAPFTKTSLMSQEPDEDLVEGGSLGEVTITCSSTAWGYCWRFETNLIGDPDEYVGLSSSYGYYAKCVYTGDPVDRCRLIHWMLYSMVMEYIYNPEY